MVVPTPGLARNERLHALPWYLNSAVPASSPTFSNSEPDTPVGSNTVVAALDLGAMLAAAVLLSNLAVR
jgi:hypothetical protein